MLRPRTRRTRSSCTIPMADPEGILQSILHIFQVTRGIQKQARYVRLLMSGVLRRKHGSNYAHIHSFGKRERDCLVVLESRVSFLSHSSMTFLLLLISCHSILVSQKQQDRLHPRTIITRLAQTSKCSRGNSGSNASPG